MSTSLYFAFVAATAALILTPGPMVALIFANTLAQGVRAGLITVAASCLAMALHLVFVVAGLAAVLSVIGAAVFWLKWIGAAYLLYLAFKAFRAPPLDLSENNAALMKSPKRLFIEAFFVAALNPKVLIFYAAFFPLFLSPTAPVTPQLALMSITFLCVAGMIDIGWTLTASRSRRFLARAGRWPNRLTGGALTAAAAGMAMFKKT